MARVIKAKNQSKETLSGLEKASVFILSIPEEYSEKILQKLEEEEIVMLTQCMASLGTVQSSTVEKLFEEFIENVGSAASVSGDLTKAEKMLLKIFDPDKVAAILEDVRGPEGKTIWDKISKIDEEILANYFKSEYPQTVAVILSKLNPAHAARVLSVMPRDEAMDIVNRMIRLEVVNRDIIDDIEKTLRTEFMTNLIKTTQTDPMEIVANIFNAFDRSTEEEMMKELENIDQEAAETIRSLMFTFDDMTKLDPAGIQTVIRVVDKTRLALALKGAPEAIKETFFSNMSERAAKMMKDDMQNMGLVKVKEVEAAQNEVVALTKDLIDKGEIELIIDDGESGDAFIE